MNWGALLSGGVQGLQQGGDWAQRFNQNQQMNPMLLQQQQLQNLMQQYGLQAQGARGNLAGGGMPGQGSSDIGQGWGGGGQTPMAQPFGMPQQPQSNPLAQLFGGGAGGGQPPLSRLFGGMGQGGMGQGGGQPQQASSPLQAFFNLFGGQ